MNDEKQNLDNLLKHPGWQLVVEAATKEIEGRLNTALASAANEVDDRTAISKVRQVVAVRKAIEAFVAWPKQRLAVLQSKAEDADSRAMDYSRRGTL
jgi:hypothetical protein